VSSGCGDDSDSKDVSPSDDSHADSSGEEGDARVRSSMDGSISKSDGSTPNNNGGDDAGEKSEADASEPTKQDASVSADASSAADAKVEGLDAATGEDASKVDAKADAKTDEQDAGEGDDQDAGDEGETDATVSENDASSDEFTEDDCKEAGGHIPQGKQECAENETTYDLAGSDKVCCVKKDEMPPPSDDGTCGGIAGIPCKDGEFCDISKYAGGQGCGVADAQGKCRTIPTDSCPGFEFLAGCDCFHHPHTACDAWKSSLSIEVDVTSCFGNP
jgi:hypothetical protein